MPVSNPGGSGTWTLITAGTTGGAASSIRIDLSANYSWIKIYIVTGTSAGTDDSLLVRLNNDSGNNYNYSGVRYDGSVAGFLNSADTWHTCFPIKAGGNLRSPGLIEIYAGETGTYRGIWSCGSAETNGSRYTSGQWTNTANYISRIDLIAGSGNLPAGTRYRVIGVSV